MVDKEDERKLKRMKEDARGWKRIKVDKSGWKWIKADEIELKKQWFFSSKSVLNLLPEFEY